MLVSPLPVIEISLAPPEELQPEPYSPFTPTMKSTFVNDIELHDNSSDSDDDGIEPYRPALLSPPPATGARALGRPIPSMRKPVAQIKASGLADEEFQALLRAARERPTGKKQDLRREVALKAHKSKQVERRALFLSKIGAPPSPSAVGMPKTPPDTPAEFHYTLPSPGLASPLALFGALAADEVACGKRTVRVERVDFRAAAAANSKAKAELERDCGDNGYVRSMSTPESTVEMPACPGLEPPTITLSPAPPARRRNARPGHVRQRSLPSLEQITERYAHAPVVAQQAPTQTFSAPTRLPAFLAARRQTPSPPPAAAAPTPKAETEKPQTARPRLACTGRIPTLSGQSPAAVFCTSPSIAHSPLPSTSPASPSCPRARTRMSTARDMLCAVRRRTVMYGLPLPVSPASSGWAGCRDVNVPEKSVGVNPKRISAPAELGVRRPRTGFAHPVLALPGGF